MTEADLELDESEDVLCHEIVEEVHEHTSRVLFDRLDLADGERRQLWIRLDATGKIRCKDVT